MQLINLRERPAAIDIITPWHFAEWQALFPHKTLDDFAADLAESLQSDALPQTWLLVDEQGEICGTGSLLLQDMTVHQELSPWLANIYIHPDKRGLGLGRLVVSQLMAQAHSRQLPTLYLFTEDQQAFYEKLGWTLLYREIYEGEWVSIMQWQVQS
ncbi:MAG TPA: N-acetyltransferase [Rheinheimera sp.]|nr:N-acetyltransferase [Rheinheimera sp.]